MVLQKIVLKDGVFESIDSEEKITNFSNKRINVGNWCLKVEDDGSVVFKKNYWSFFRLFNVEYTLDRNGLEKLEKTRNGDVIKGYRNKNILPHGQKLKDGNLMIMKRSDGQLRIVFKNGNYKKYRRENLLTEIQFIDPNKTYTIRNVNESSKFCRTILQTDGEVETIFIEEIEGVKIEKVEVKNATWSVLEIDQEEYDEDGKYISKHPRELYTLKNPKELDISQINEG